MKMLIGGKGVEAADGGKQPVLNPATLELIDEVPAATKADVDTALTFAQMGAKEWKACPLHERIRILRRFLEIYRSHRNELVDLLQQETGKITAAAAGLFLVMSSPSGTPISSERSTAMVDRSTCCKNSSQISPRRSRKAVQRVLSVISHRSFRSGSQASRTVC